MKPTQKQTVLHEPVLLEEVLEWLQPAPGLSYLDATSGYGGHAGAVLGVSQAWATSVLVDRDIEAITHLGHLFSEQKPTIIQGDYAMVAERFVHEGGRFDMILADIGVSSPHMDKASRGFSFRFEAPLDMRMDQTSGITASSYIDSTDVATLTDVLRRYGEEPRASRIAKAIIAARPVNTTTELADIVKQCVPGYSKTHPATRTFQALRIVVNDELSQLERFLSTLPKLLNDNGRAGIITFHSLEDRIVKRAFKEQASMGYEAELQILTKDPVVPSQHEISINPRSRSAKLRVVSKIKKLA